MADRYLLESGAPDGYLLEDSSGVLLLEQSAGGGPTGSFRVSAPAQTVAREVVGYGLAFAALGALLAGTPPQVGAAEYTVGTHAGAINEAQPKPRVWGTDPQLIPAPAVTFVGRPLIVGPQFYQDLQAYVHGTAPDNVPRPLLKTIVVPQQQYDPAYGHAWGPVPAPIVVLDNPIGRTLEVPPQQPDAAYGLTWGPQPDGIDVKPPHTLWSAPEQIALGLARVWGPLPAPLVSVDAPIGRTDIVPPQYDLTPPSLVWGPTPEGIDKPPPKTQYAAPEQSWTAYAKTWGPRPQPLVTVDSPIGRTIAVPPLPDTTVVSKAWGYSFSLAPQIGRTLFSAPSQLDNPAAWVWGRKVGLDVPVGRFKFYKEAFYEPVQFGRVFHRPPDSVAPPAESFFRVVYEITADQLWFDARQGTQTFKVTNDEQDFAAIGDETRFKVAGMQPFKSREKP